MSCDHLSDPAKINGVTEAMRKIDECDLLIVDDEPSFRLFLENCFKHKMPGIIIKSAEDGEEAYCLALKFRPHIIGPALESLGCGVGRFPN